MKKVVLFDTQLLIPMIRNQYSNDELITALKAVGERQNAALSWIYRQKKWRSSVFKFVFDRGGDEHLAEDIFQEGMAIFARKLMQNEFKGKSTLFTYFIGICKNCYLREKHKTKRDDRKLDSSKTIEESPEERLIDIEYKEEKRNLMKSLFGQLKEKCQKILHLYSLSYPMEEIAQEMGYGKAQAAKNAALKCRKHLREMIISNPVIYSKVQKMI